MVPDSVNLYASILLMNYLSTNPAMVDAEFSPTPPEEASMPELQALLTLLTEQAGVGLQATGQEDGPGGCSVHPPHSDRWRNAL